MPKNPTSGVTWIDPEERAYPKGGFTRRGLAILRKNGQLSLPGLDILQYGTLVPFRASIADTYFSVPAKIRRLGMTITGYLSVEDGVYYFTPTGVPPDEET